MDMPKMFDTQHGPVVTLHGPTITIALYPLLAILVGTALALLFLFKTRLGQGIIFFGTMFAAMIGEAKYTLPLMVFAAVPLVVFGHPYAAVFDLLLLLFFIAMSKVRWFS
jgi:hypothetical protein